MFAYPYAKAAFTSENERLLRGAFLFVRRAISSYTNKTVLKVPELKIYHPHLDL